MTDQPKIAETVARLRRGGWDTGIATEAADILEALAADLAAATERADKAVAERDAWRGQIGTIAALVPIPEVVRATGSIADLVAWLTEMVHRTEAAEADRDRLAAELAKARATITQITAAWGKEAARVDDLRKELADARLALVALHYSVCSENGFAASVRLESGKAYPWPSLETADAMVRAYLAKGDTDDRA